jgi:hypothetical protein
MRPAHRKPSRWSFLDIREQVVFNFRSRSQEHPNTGPSSDYRFSEANPIRSFFSSL